MNRPPSQPRSSCSLDQVTKDFLESQFNHQIIRRPWLCDVKAANASVIHAHNREFEGRDEPIEPKFASVEATPGRLEDLLAEDFAHLCRGTPWLAPRAREFVIFELAGASPNAEIISMHEKEGTLHAIGFRACLLRFLHAAYSKIYILSAAFRHAECLEDHDHIMDRAEYSDTHLLSGFYNDIELLFDHQRLFVPIDPPHWADPYDYCGRIEGTRRFILAHEVGHAIWPNEDRSHLVEDLAEYELDEGRAQKWSEELWCDTFALQALLAVYGEEPLEGSRLFDAEDLVTGVLQYTTLMDVVELVLSDHGVTTLDYPPSELREQHLRMVIKEHPLYENSPQFAETVRRVWRRNKVFSRYIGCIGTPEDNGTMWSNQEFVDRLSPFGRRACDTIREQSLQLLAAREEAVKTAYAKNRRAIERGFMADPRDAPRFDDTF